MDELQQMAVALGELKMEVRKNHEATEKGFALMAQQLRALTTLHHDRDTACRTCEAQLRAEITAAEQRALVRESTLAERLNRMMEAIDKRLRSLEISRGWLTGLIALGSALLGALAPVIIQWLKG